MYTFLITASSFAAPGVAMLQAAGCRILYVKDEAELGTVMASENIDAVISRTMSLNASAIQSCASLKVISKHGAGYNNIDVAAATARHIPVFFTPGANAQSVAELAIGLIIAVARTIPLHDRTLRAGGWSRSEMGLQLSGRTIGVIGLGNIGQKVARLAEAFGMHVLGYDPRVKNISCEMAKSLPELLGRAQILSVNCPLNDETRGLIGAAELAQLPRNAIVVNTARGGVVVETALAEAVASGHVFGAGLDDFEAEPIAAAHPFNKSPRIVMTPHVGASTREALDTVSLMSVDNALAFLDKRPFDKKLCVNPSVLQNQPMVSL
jgi:D-3-phosphoglycerate dehydrogenase / 2-oxoglutarate reductase